MTVLDDFRGAYGTRVRRGNEGNIRTQRPALLTMLARLLGTLAAVVLGFARKSRSEVLTIAGLAIVVVAAYDYSRTIGLLATGAALLVLEWLLRE